MWLSISKCTVKYLQYCHTKKIQLSTIPSIFNLIWSPVVTGLICSRPPTYALNTGIWNTTRPIRIQAKWERYLNWSLDWNFKSHAYLEWQPATSILWWFNAAFFQPERPQISATFGTSQNISLSSCSFFKLSHKSTLGICWNCFMVFVRLLFMLLWLQHSQSRDKLNI